MGETEAPVDPATGPQDALSHLHGQLRSSLRSASGRSCEIVALFADIRGFSSFSERNESLAIAKYLRAAVTGILDRYFHDATFFKEITKAYKAAFEKAAKRVTNSEGKSGRVKFKAETDYYPFRMKESLPVVQRAIAAVSATGGTPAVRAANGGLDANWMVRHRVPTVTFGAGQNEAHTIDEWINLDEYHRACALALRLATT